MADQNVHCERVDEMASAHSNGVRSARKWPPGTYHPCTPHASRYWRKRANGKLYYFGPRWGSAQQALDDYESRIVAISPHSISLSANSWGFGLALSNRRGADRKLARTIRSVRFNITLIESKAAVAQLLDQIGEWRESQRALTLNFFQSSKVIQRVLDRNRKSNVSAVLSRPRSEGQLQLSNLTVTPEKNVFSWRIKYTADGRPHTRFYMLTTMESLDKIQASNQSGTLNGGVRQQLGP